MADIDIYKAKLPQNDTNLYRFRDGVIEPLVDTSYEETDYANPLTFETLQAQTAKNTNIKLEPIQDLHGYNKPWVGGAGKNLFDISLVNTSKFNISNLTISNKVTDTRTYFSFQLQKYNNGSLVGAALFTRDINSTGEIAIGFTLSGDDYDSIRLKHNGANADIEIALIPFTKSGSFAISFNVLGANPNSVDGLKLSNIQIEAGSQATSYEPYENICPISGHNEIKIDGCGKNLWSDGDESFTLNKTIQLDKPLEVGKYTFSALVTSSDTNQSTCRVNFMDVDNTEIVATYIGRNTRASVTANLVKECTSIILYASTQYSYSVGDTALFKDIQLEQGEQSTDYEPYQESNNLSIDLPSTVYGGVLDLESGEIVVDKGIVDLGSLSWSNATRGGWSQAQYNPFYCSGLGNVFDGTCSCFVPDNSNNVYNGVIDGSICYNPSSNYIQLFFSGFNGKTNTEIKTALTGQTMCCKLKDIAKFTLYISPEHLKLLKAQNNLTTSQYTQIKVTYRNGVFATLEELSDTANGIYEEISGDATTVSGNPINFTTREKQKSKSTLIDLEPIQDLHGFTKPWVGGAGKNKLPLVISTIKTVNTAGTWNDNVFTHNNGGKFTILTDNDNNVVGIKLSDTFSAESNLTLTTTGDLGFNGNILTGGQTNEVSIFAYDDTLGQSAMDSSGVGVTIPDTFHNYRIVIRSKQKQYSTQITCLPMIRLSSVTDSTFEPYTNIASISGRSSVDIDGCGKNLLPLTLSLLKSRNTSGTWSGNTFVRYGITYVIHTDENDNITSIDISGTATARADLYLLLNSDSDTRQYLYNFIKNKTVFVNGIPIDNYGVVIACQGFQQDGIGTGEDNGKGTEFSANDKFIDYVTCQIYIRIMSGTAITGTITVRPMLCLASNKSEYEPYKPSNDITIQLGTTVYGGKLDVEKGELVVNKTIKKFSDLTWLYSSQYQVFISQGDIADAPRPVVPGYPVISSAYNDIYDGTNKSISHIKNGNIGFALHAVTNIRTCICIGDYRFTDETNLINAVGNETFVYPLATPQTIQLTPQQVQLLKGINNISTTGTTITVTFKNGSVAHLDDLPENVFTDLDKEKLASIDTLAITLDLLTHTLIVTQDI